MNSNIEQMMLDATADMPQGYYVPYQYWERFAKMIVKECIGCCEQVISDPVPESVDTWLNGGEQCIQEIKEHFGVEE